MHNEIEKRLNDGTITKSEHKLLYQYGRYAQKPEVIFYLMGGDLDLSLIVIPQTRFTWTIQQESPYLLLYALLLMLATLFCPPHLLQDSSSTVFVAFATGGLILFLWLAFKFSIVQKRLLQLHAAHAGKERQSGKKEDVDIHEFIAAIQGRELETNLS